MGDERSSYSKVYDSNWHRAKHSCKRCSMTTTSYNQRRFMKWQSLPWIKTSKRDARNRALLTFPNKPQASFTGSSNHDNYVQQLLHVAEVGSKDLGSRILWQNGPRIPCSYKYVRKPASQSNSLLSDSDKFYLTGWKFQHFFWNLFPLGHS